jgi:uncharacterized protein YndB with AHSA1/START domain
MQAEDTAVRRTITVEATQEHAFAVFTSGMGSWWPLDTHHIGAVDAVDVVIEPHAGGRCYERGVDGSECDWGRVLAWEPPSRFLWAWMLGADWEFDPDPSRATEIEVRFVVEGPRTTRVELEHRGFERLGDRAGEVLAAIGSEGGWSSLLARYGEAAKA